MLTTAESLIYTGVSRQTFVKRKVPYSQGKKKNHKVFDHKILDQYFPTAPKIMPPVITQLVSAPSEDTVKLDISEHQATFRNILKKVQEIQADKFQSDVMSSLVESLIKASILESHYFEQLQLTPEDRNLFQSYKQSLDLKMNLTRRLGL